MVPRIEVLGRNEVGRIVPLIKVKVVPLKVAKNEADFRPVLTPNARVTSKKLDGL
jgi:hypothetical protein